MRSVRPRRNRPPHSASQLPALEYLAYRASRISRFAHPAPSPNKRHHLALLIYSQYRPRLLQPLYPLPIIPQLIQQDLLGMLPQLRRLPPYPRRRLAIPIRMAAHLHIP